MKMTEQQQREYKLYRAELSAERMNQINREFRDLCAELDSLQARALHRVEEIENEFDGVALPDELKKNFLTMKKLITRV